MSFGRGSGKTGYDAQNRAAITRDALLKANEPIEDALASVGQKIDETGGNTLTSEQYNQQSDIFQKAVEDGLAKVTTKTDQTGVTTYHITITNNSANLHQMSGLADKASKAVETATADAEGSYAGK